MSIQYELARKFTAAAALAALAMAGLAGCGGDEKAETVTTTTVSETGAAQPPAPSSSSSTTTPTPSPTPSPVRDWSPSQGPTDFTCQTKENREQVFYSFTVGEKQEHPDIALVEKARVRMKRPQLHYLVVQIDNRGDDSAGPERVDFELADKSIISKDPNPLLEEWQRDWETSHEDYAWLQDLRNEKLSTKRRAKAGEKSSYLVVFTEPIGAFDRARMGFAHCARS